MQGSAHALPLADESAQCVVTSPPYFGLRKYAGAQEFAWGGEPDHEHAWGRMEKGKRKDVAPAERSRAGRLGTDGRQRGAANDGGRFCACGAWRGALGLEPTAELYTEHMVTVFAEIRRVLRPDGIAFLNLGDSYASGGRRTVAPDARSRARAMDERAPTPDGLKSKDLIGIPWRVALALQGFAVIGSPTLRQWADWLAEARDAGDWELVALVEQRIRAQNLLDALRADGWWLRSDVIFHKPNVTPESVRDRPTRAHEYLFLLTKSGAPTFWTHRELPGTRVRPEPDHRWVDRLHGDRERATEPAAGWRDERLPDGRKRWRRVNLWTGHDYFYDRDAIREPMRSGPSDIRKMVEGRDRLGGKTLVTADPLYSANKTTNIGRKRGVGNPGAGRNARSVWTVATQPYKGAHLATMPQALAERCVLAGSSPRACGECGAPWARTPTPRPRAGDWDPDHDLPGRGHPSVQEGPDGDDSYEQYLPETTVWRRTCEHGDGSERGVVLDPFNGAGTTGLVALRHGRGYVGVDISREYLEQSRRRMVGARRARKGAARALTAA